MYILLPYDTENDGKAISEAELKRVYPKAFAYFQQFRDKLLARAHYRASSAKSVGHRLARMGAGSSVLASREPIWIARLRLSAVCTQFGGRTDLPLR